MLKVRQILEVVASFYRTPMTVGAAIAIARLEEKSGARIDGLSGGQRQCFYYALAVVGNPEVLFFTNPRLGWMSRAGAGSSPPILKPEEVTA